MPRYARHEVPDAVYHLISRIVNREFRIRGAVERAEYLRRVPRVLAHCDWRPLAYCLMCNHVHWAGLSCAQPSSRFIQPLHAGYALWLNRHQGRLGPVFAGRHTSIRVPEEHLARLVAYLHNNVVRAGVVRDPADSDWSSHRAFIGDVRPPPWLDVLRALDACGFSASPSGRLAFHEYVLARAGDPRDPRLSGVALDELRATARRVTGGAVELGGPVATEQGLRAEVRVLEGATLHPRWHGHARDVATIAARLMGVSLDDLCSNDRRRDVVAARRVALIAWTALLGREQQTMAAALKLSPSAASRLLRDDARAVLRLAHEANLVAEAAWAERES